MEGVELPEPADTCFRIGAGGEMVARPADTHFGIDPTIRTLMRVADATGFELVIGLRRPNNPAPNPNALRAQGFDLLGTLRRNPQDGLADFVALREPSPLEGPR